MYLIRKAIAADVDTIQHIADKTWWVTYAPILAKEQIAFMLDELYSTEKILFQINHNTQTYLILVEDDIPVAFASYSPREEEPEIYKLHKLYCLPSTQGKGFGKILINEVISKTKEAGIKTLELNVNRHNKAQAFYEKMGFRVVHAEDIPIGDYSMNDYVMRKDL